MDIKVSKISEDVLKQISDLHKVKEASVYNIRENGKLLARHSDKDIEIVSKTDKDGIDIKIHKGVKDRRVDIPVILSGEGLRDKVYNDFYVEDGAVVVIVAGCVIHNCGGEISSHDGIHNFYV